MDTIAMFAVLLFFGITLCQGIGPGNWSACKDGQSSSASVSDTSQNVANLRAKMAASNISAYIIPSGDFHMSEFVSGYDKRRQFISGFTGSAGTAVVTDKKTALWTDGRYFLQAEAELGCSWILMREGENDVPTIVEWLGEEFAGNKKTVNVGACPYFFGNDDWLKYREDLKNKGINLANIRPDMIDSIWTANRPDFPSTNISVHPLQYAGQSWQDKMSAVQESMEKEDVDVLVITGLDEIAWLHNMRASDIRGFVNDPFFYSFAIIERKSKATRLYIKDVKRKLSAEPSDPESNITISEHLNSDENGAAHCQGSGHCVAVHEYDFPQFITNVAELARSEEIKRMWVSFHCNYAVYSNIPQSKVFVKNTPVAMMKARKNDVEVQGMKNSNIRDAAALARFMTKLEREVRDGVNWTEVSAANELSKYRSMQDLSRGDSFAAISSVGPHAAINHYFPNDKTDVPITTDEFYLLDSGGQYIDGTTDITRTFLFRDPTPFEKECYTRVLMGQINLAMAKWNKGKYGREIDAFARQPLWDVGLIYNHGTGHGIGHYLSVHEGPARISNYHPLFVWDVPLDEQMFFSDEPGFYQEGEFGIRLENLIFVKKVETKYTFPGATMLGMETITYFPYEPHLIDTSVMSEKQITWLNDYNTQCLEKVGTLLKNQDDEEAYSWIKSRTAHINTTSGCDARVSSTTTILATLLFVLVFLF